MILLGIEYASPYPPASYGNKMCIIIIKRKTFIVVDPYLESMDLNSLLAKEEPDKITFHDKLSLMFMVIGAIFVMMIVLALVVNLLNIQTVEFQTPFG
jgi:hypothetical protein